VGVLSDGEVTVGPTGKQFTLFTSCLAQPMLLAFLCIECVWVGGSVCLCMHMCAL